MDKFSLVILQVTWWRLFVYFGGQSWCSFSEGIVIDPNFPNDISSKRINSKKFQCQNSNKDKAFFLWTINRGPNTAPAHFFGTIHVPYTKVWNHIPSNAKRAFRLSQNIYFELDLTDPQTLSELTDCQLLPDGKTLLNILPYRLYHRLTHHLSYIKSVFPMWLKQSVKRNQNSNNNIASPNSSERLYADYLFESLTQNWKRKRPVWVMLLVNSLTQAEVTARGVPVLDLYLSQLSSKLKKNSGGIESVYEQCAPLNQLTLKQVLFALNQTLSQFEHDRKRLQLDKIQDYPSSQFSSSHHHFSQSTSYSIDDLVDHYNCGDINDDIFNKEIAQVPNFVNMSSSYVETDFSMAQTIDQYFKNELIYKRNRRIAHRVAKLLQAFPKQSFLFAFGAGHFLGERSILDYLAAEGFQTQRTSLTKPIKIKNYNIALKSASNNFNADLSPSSDESSDGSKRRRFPINSPNRPSHPKYLVASLLLHANQEPTNNTDPEKHGTKFSDKLKYQKHKLKRWRRKMHRLRHYHKKSSNGTEIKGGQVKKKKLRAHNFNELWIRITDNERNPISIVKARDLQSPLPLTDDQNKKMKLIKKQNVLNGHKKLMIDISQQSDDSSYHFNPPRFILSPRGFEIVPLSIDKAIENNMYQTVDREITSDQFDNAFSIDSIDEIHNDITVFENMVSSASTLNLSIHFMLVTYLVVCFRIS